jgi:hypothetical protein
MAEPELSPPQPAAKASLQEMITDAIRYWEPRRFIYNGVLALIVIGYFCGALPESQKAISFDGFLFVFILAVLANLCYCSAYVADIFAQFSGFRVLWLRWRWLLLALGITFAGIITRFFALGFFFSYHT